MLTTRRAASMTTMAAGLLAALPSLALAQDEAPEAPVDSAPAKLELPWSESSGGTLAVGIGVGSWGGVFTQTLEIHAPFMDYFGASLKLASLMDWNVERSDMGGRLELFGSTPVYLNIMRLYGGGGIQIFYPIDGVPDKELSFGGGGHFGFEFFLNSRFAWTLEVGGSSGAGGSFGAGATILGGCRAYLF